MNFHKWEEFDSLLKPLGNVKLLRADEILRNAGKLGLAEQYASYAENAMAKARLANQGSHYPCLADDSGLEVEALGGKPGVKSHHFAIAKAGQTQDAANVDKLLTELKGHPMAKRQARFVCSLALVMEGICLEATGTLSGTIAEAPSGNHGFGYDPVFIPQGATKTLAQMSAEEKNAISHRAAAVQSLLAQIQEKGIIFAKP